MMLRHGMVSTKEMNKMFIEAAKEAKMKVQELRDKTIPEVGVDKR